MCFRVFRGCRALWAAAKGVTRAYAPSPNPTAFTTTTKPRTLARPNGIMKALAVCPALRKFVGVPASATANTYYYIPQLLCGLGGRWTNIIRSKTIETAIGIVDNSGGEAIVSSSNPLGLC
ncbi:hypothetical protein HHK36_023113 [Tetracentron sinense]|uniref:Uncharacterized protein n=1 Tax=Tetracentron sinense TaxID=13715 RepID=A0A835D8E0_TETSI|nr:hypothetical protein HHK36_023113 [Tetracentron sinense]